jgi:hypothetical protein
VHRSTESGLRRIDIARSLRFNNQKQVNDRERKMDLGQLTVMAICGVGTLGALTAMAFFALRNSPR